MELRAHTSLSCVNNNNNNNNNNNIQTCVINIHIVIFNITKADSILYVTVRNKITAQYNFVL